MGRFKSTKPPSQVPQGMPEGSPPPGYSQYDPNDWPTEFPNGMIGIDRDGVINEWKNVIKRYEDVRWIPGSLEAIRTLRLKGYQIMMFSDQPNIMKGLLKAEEVDKIMNNFYMTEFGKNGIFSIDGFLYNTSDDSRDPFAKPNTGMFQRMEQMYKVNIKGGYYVGDTIEDVKMAQNGGAKPVLVRTGFGSKTEKENFKGINSKYKDVQIFDNLLDFANSL
jgi:D-glycero-D-manno-heptose 1,7-bisphosphate phosphatase